MAVRHRSPRLGELDVQAVGTAAAVAGSALGADGQDLLLLDRAVHLGPHPLLAFRPSPSPSPTRTP
ncbi:hypothetical protein ACI1MP_00110 [Kitasatospora griseola]|uniref:hypothetical protein n=1 Tax=Kitasatospora griseola TaxID=2064 RepID=UPI003855E743